MRPEPRDEVVRIEAAGNDAIEDEQRFGDFRLPNGVDHIEVGLLVEDVEVFRNGGVVEFFAGKSDELVKNAQRIAECTICLNGHYMQRSFFGFYPLLCADALEVLHHVRHGDAVEVEDLASRQDGWENLVLFGGGQDEDRMRRWFFERLQKRIEGRLRQHMHLVDDVDLVLSLLRGDAHLVHNRPDVFDLVVGSGIQLEDVERVILLVVGIKPVDGAGENARRRGLAYAPRTAEEVRLGNLLLVNGLLEGARDAVLPDDRVPVLRAVLPCGHGILRLLSGFHWSCEYRTHSNASPNRFMNRFPTEKPLVFKVLLCTFAPH